MKKTHIILVDDNALIRDGIKLMLASEENVIIENEAQDGHEAMEMIKQNDYDVVLMDINMPNLNGIEATKEIKKINPNIKVLANSSHIGTFYIREMLEAGASGYIRKGESKQDYLEAIWTVTNGGIYLSDEIDNRTYDQVFGYLKRNVAM